MLVAIAVFELWQRYEASERAKASAAFIAAQTSPFRAPPNPFSPSSPRPLPAVTGCSRASSRPIRCSRAGKPGPAINLYKAIAKDDNGPRSAPVVRLRARLGRSPTRPERTICKHLLAPLTDPSSPWSQIVGARSTLPIPITMRRISGAALTEYASLASDPQAPDALRQRARAMAAYLESGGENHFRHYVPPPPPPAAPAGCGDGRPVAGRRRRRKTMTFARAALFSVRIYALAIRGRICFERLQQFEFARRSLQVSRKIYASRANGILGPCIGPNAQARSRTRQDSAAAAGARKYRNPDWPEPGGVSIECPLPSGRRADLLTPNLGATSG